MKLRPHLPSEEVIGMADVITIVGGPSDDPKDSRQKDPNGDNHAHQNPVINASVGRLAVSHQGQKEMQSNQRKKKLSSPAKNTGESVNFRKMSFPLGIGGSEVSENPPQNK